jgi:serine/threonine protein kinase
MIRCASCGALHEGGMAIDTAALVPGLERALGPHYRVEELIGRGGFAVVFRVRDERLDRNLAAKVLIPEFAAVPAVAARFRREAQTAARLNHPGIVPIYFVGAESEAPCFAMPLIEGEPLSARIRREGQLPVSVALSVARDVATALDFAHGKGVVHRDVKPDNILLEFSTGRSLLADFGIAKALEAHPTVTASGIALGTPHYMAPEQAESSRDVDARADIYSLGVVLFETLAGALPFNGATAHAIMAQHLGARVPDVHDRRPELGEALNTVFHRAMAKDPAERFASAGEMVRVLEESLGEVSLRHSGGTTVPVQRMDDRLFTRRGPPSNPVEALSAAVDLPTLTHAAEALETFTIEAAARADGGQVVSAIQAISVRAGDSNVGFRQPALDLLERLGSNRAVAHSLAGRWRTADTQDQVIVEGILASLLPGIAEPLLDLARRDKAPEFFLLADRVGALSDAAGESIARDQSPAVARAFVMALRESQRAIATIEKWLFTAAKHPSSAVRATAQDVAALRGGSVAERMGRLGSGDADQAVRIAAVGALGASRRREVLPELSRLLDGGTKEDQVAAAQALGTLGVPAVLPLLARVFERKSLFRKERGPVQVAAAEAVARLPREVSHAMLTMLSVDSDHAIARVAGEALRKPAVS